MYRPARVDERCYGQFNLKLERFLDVIVRKCRSLLLKVLKAVQLAPELFRDQPKTEFCIPVILSPRQAEASCQKFP